MASTQSQSLHNFILTPQQQNLLFRALTSNQPGGSNGNPNSALSLSPDSLSKSPIQNQQGSPDYNTTNGTSNNSIQESPFLDYDYDLGPDTSFDFDFGNDGHAKMIGDLPGTSPNDDSKASSPDNDISDKRSHPDDEEDDEIDEGGGKRREGEGKVPKKPGRKPLMNEPSSKRKAQNRAAQRAFRERKEKHLKDLETKVEELEKASTATNNENSQLRAQIEKLTMELNEYKKKLTLMGPSGGSRALSAHPTRSQTFGSAAIQNLSDVNFQFEFPKFGVLPGPQGSFTNTPKQSLYYSPPSSGNSPKDKSKDSPNSSKSRENSDAQSKDGSSKSSASPYDSTFGASVSRTSLDSSHNSVNGANTGSPCSSTGNTNMGPSSSCGTSPEPCTQSPMGFKPVDTLTTIGEEQPSLTTDSMNQFNNLHNIDFSNIDWLSQQNGGQFDPQLFGDYREPQDNILASTTFDDSFFNEAFDVDFTTPYNVAPSPNAPKKNLIAEIDARKESEDTIITTNNGKLLTCNNIWEKLQACPRVQSGDLDLDGLCSDLQKKAKCGGSGAVVDEKDFKAVMTKYLGTDSAGRCPDAAPVSN
ncbi:PAP1-domain-containing protein [Hypoxylon trugodes]|uniref:PAP1-domain-containing protein n=1 Tax=Hypoxylon trugodes TaxID=326681 RepID=UPI00219CDDAE|nr:PAP1-domain-containing protein [Hypoxylon trugodes]KAI1387257.1 PAP1-domain-containing protein [Hypoxylon trugodes]